LINDAFSLAAGGRLKYDQALDLTLYLGDRERSLSPWVTAFLSLDKLAGVLYYSPVYPSLNAYIVQLLSTPYAQVGWEEGANDSVSTQQMRTFVLDKMCVYGVAARKAGEKLLAWKETGEKISPNFRKVVYRYGMKAVGDQQVWRWMMETYKSESNAQEKLKLLLGLTATAEPWILSHLLELARDEAIIRSQDYFTLLTYMSWNKVGEPIVWDFVRCSWQYLVERFTLNDRLLGRLIPSITEKFATPLRLEEMRTFFAKYPQAGAGENYRKIALETVENNIKFVSDGGAEAVQRWLDAH
jgi:glutamyl aminopeptidase